MWKRNSDPVVGGVYCAACFSCEGYNQQTCQELSDCVWFLASCLSEQYAIVRKKEVMHFKSASAHCYPTDVPSFRFCSDQI
ncbi:hypothetical protein AKJ16_DCAP16376 [Drosera capensis]